MLPQKLYFLPFSLNQDEKSSKSLTFWRKVEQNGRQELHFFLIFESQNPKENYFLVNELWKIINKVVSEATLEQQAIPQPEHICELVLRNINHFLLSWKEENSTNRLEQIGLVLGFATPESIYFTRRGGIRLIFWRNQKFFIADENLSPSDHPDNFARPFSEFVEGNLQRGDRLLVATSPMLQSLSLEEISSLTLPQNYIGAFQNIVRSLEVLPELANNSFLWGEVSSFDPQKEDFFREVAGSEFKESQIGQFNFKEYNPFRPPQVEKRKSDSSFLPWKKIISALGKTIKKFLSLPFKIIILIFGPLAKKINTLSPIRKVILSTSLILFLIFLGFVSRSLLNKPATSGVAIDYANILDRANKLKEDSDNALIYQDEDKAKQDLNQAISLLDEVSKSSDWGIKALKMKDELNNKLATLEKSENVTDISNLWSITSDKGNLKKIALGKSGSFTLISDSWAGKLTLANNQSVETKDYGNPEVKDQKVLLLSFPNDLALIFPQTKTVRSINPTNNQLSDSGNLEANFKNSFSVGASFTSFAYFFDPAENQIQQFSWEKNNLIFGRSWFKEDYKDLFQNNPVISLSVDGNLFLLTKNGQISRFSGGKKTSWKNEDLSVALGGEKDILLTKPDDINLYVLNPAEGRIVIFEKESGKIKSQIKNSLLTQALDFQVDESKKEIYFITSTSFYRLKFE